MRRQIIAVATAALAGGFLAATGPAGAASADMPDPAGQYVAFGDSFVSGPGIAPQRDNKCEQSEKNFPSLVAKKFDFDDFVDASCAGAKTTDLTAPQEGRDAPPQLDALTADTTLITFGTLGGNDMGLVSLAMGCIGAQACPTQEQDDKANAGIETARVNMVAGIAEAKVRSPQAEIYVIGYGTYLQSGDCAGLESLGITSAEREYVQGKINQLSDMLATVAEEADVHFVDMREIPGIENHTACAEPNAQWIRTLETYSDGQTLHPSHCGHVAMAQQVVRTIEADNGQPVTPFKDTCISYGPDTADRMAHLNEVADNATIEASCTSKKLSKAKLVVRLKGHKGLVTKVRFFVGEKKIGSDTTAPYVVKAKAKPLVKHKGKIIAEVKFQDVEVSTDRTLNVKRPKCLRR